MNRRINILRLLLVLIIIAIIFVLVFVYLNRDKASDDDSDNNNKFNEYELIKKWYFVDSKFYDENGKMIEKPFDLEDFYLEFHDDKVDVCYQEGCYTTPFLRHDNILTIGSFDYFSGTFEVSYEPNMMLLKTVEDGAYIIYYFGKPVDVE